MAKFPFSPARSMLKTVSFTALLLLSSCSSAPHRDVNQAAFESRLADTRSWVAEQALNDVVMKGSAGVPLLVEALKSQEPNTRARAALGLGQLGPTAREAVPALGATLQDRNLKVIETVIQALQRIGTAQAVTLLEEDKSRHVGPVIQNLKNPSPEVRDSAVRELFAMGPRAQYATEPLLTALRDDSVRVRTNAELTLLRLGVKQSTIEQAKTLAPPSPKGEATPASPAPKARPFVPSSPTSGYSQITKESELISTAERVSFDQLARKRHDFEGLYVVFSRVKFADDPRLLYLAEVGDYVVVPLRDESGAVIPAKANPSQLLVAVPPNLVSQVRDERRAHPENYFRVRVKVHKAGPYSIATIADFQITE